MGISFLGGTPAAWHSPRSAVNGRLALPYTAAVRIATGRRLRLYAITVGMATVASAAYGGLVGLASGGGPSQGSGSASSKGSC